MQPVIAAASIDAFYQAISGVSFTLLGLWFVIVQLKYKQGTGEGTRRRHAYGVAMFFLFPGIAAMLSAVNSDLHAALAAGLRDHRARSAWSRSRST